MSTTVQSPLGRLALAWVLPLCASIALSAGALAQEVVADPPSRVARLSLTEGEVVMAPAGTEEWAEAILNRPVTSGDRLWTESGARAELQIGSAAAYLNERTSFGFVDLDDDVMQMSLTEGSMTIRVRRRSEKEVIQVETPNVAVSLREPGEYHIEVDAKSDRTIVKTRHGEAEIFGGEVTYLVRSNESGTFEGLEQLSAQIQPLGPRTAFENWANDRERRETESESAKYVSRDVVGYEDLDEHGDWHHEPEYGYVWRPRYVSHTWAPYRDGRWVWVSPWGWTWVDHAPWGFAPFHYGRWAHVRDRWCWVPGPRHYRPVYAPALVGWIGSPHVSVSVSFGSGIGWFPLAPREIYIPGYRYSPRYIRHVNVSNTIIVNNTYITNVYRGHYRDFDYRYRTHPRAVTAVAHGQFIGGRPVLGRVMRVDARELQQWRTEYRPPALAPDRASVLAGSVRRAPPLHRTHDRTSAGFASRVAFDTEQRQIEANGGRPIGRTELFRDRPKERSDFNPRGRGAPRVATQDGAVRGFSQQTPRVQSLPARERSSSGETRAHTSTPESRSLGDRSKHVDRSAEREVRQSTRPPQVERMHEQRDGSRERSAPRSSFSGSPSAESRRSAPRIESNAPRIRTAPEARSRFETNRSAPPVRESTPRIESQPRFEQRSAQSPVQRSAPSSQPRSSNHSASPPRSHSAPKSNGGGRSSSQSRGNFRDR